LLGAVNWALPATVGNGNIMFPYIVKAGLNGGVSQRLLVCTGFARMFLLGVSMNCGFVGGMIFPFLTMGMIAGTVMYLNYPWIPIGLCSGTFMVAICCGIVPMPFTFTCLSVFMFYFGTYQTVPVFVACITSYLIVCGSGLMERIANGRKKDDAAGADEQKQQAQDKEKQKQEADEFALKQYLGSKRNADAPTTFSHSASAGGHH
jgi:H+/Cl- antiporter ClcA